MKVAARAQHFYVLWPHRCPTRWFQPSLKSEARPPVPIRQLCPLRFGHGKDMGIRKAAVFLKNGMRYLPLHVALSREHNLGGGPKGSQPPTLEPGGEGLGLSRL